MNSEEKSKEILELAYQVFQDEEYSKLHNYVFGNEQVNSISEELMNKINLLLENSIDVTNIEDYATKYYEEYISNQLRR